jgi:hypothetical protein
MRYFIAPRSGEKSYQNFLSSIKHGVPYEKIESLLANEGRKILSNQKIIYAWGNRASRSASWQKMEPGDFVLFYAHRKLVSVGRVIYKQQSRDLALAMWPPDEKGNPWEYTFFLDNIKSFEIPMRFFNDLVGWQSNYVVQGFHEIDKTRIQRINEKFSTIENFFKEFNAKDIVESLTHDSIYINPKKDIVINELKHTLDFFEVKKRLHKSDPKRKSGYIDFEKQHARNSEIGSLGEALVVSFERERLKKAGRSDLSQMVKRVSMEDSYSGYDILSFEASGKNRFIEVKSTTNKFNDYFSFIISENEKNVAGNRNDYFVYLVFDVEGNNPGLQILKNPFLESDKLLIVPRQYRVEGKLI